MFSGQRFLCFILCCMSLSFLLILFFLASSRLTWLYLIQPGCILSRLTGVMASLFLFMLFHFYIVLLEFILSCEAMFHLDKLNCFSPGFISSHRALSSHLTLSCLTWPYLLLPDLISSHLTLSRPTWPYLVSPGVISSHLTLSLPAVPYLPPSHSTPRCPTWPPPCRTPSCLPADYVPSVASPACMAAPPAALDTAGQRLNVMSTLS